MFIAPGITRGNEAIRANLPPSRNDLYFDYPSEELGAAVVETGIAVLRQFKNTHQAEQARSFGQHLTRLHLPSRAVRWGISQMFSDTTKLPDVFLQRPARVNPDNAYHLVSTVRPIIESMLQTDVRLKDTRAIKLHYRQPLGRLTTLPISRTSSEGHTGLHQDSIGIRDLGYSLQTARGIWHLQPSVTKPGTPDFTFDVLPGDLVVIAERATQYPDDAFGGGKLPVNHGYRLDDAFVQGSIVHDSYNLADRPRFNLNAFSVER